MRGFEQRTWPRWSGRALAGLTTAALLAGCGGGGGDNGGGNGGGGGGGGNQPVVVAGPVTVPANNAQIVTVGNATPPATTPPTAATPELDLLAGASPAPNGVTVSILTDPSAPAIPATTGTAESVVYDFEPSGTQFSGSGNSIYIKVPYNSAVTDATLLFIYEYQNGNWVPVTGSNGLVSSIADTTHHIITAQATNLVTGRTNGTGPADYVVLQAPGPPMTPGN